MADTLLDEMAMPPEDTQKRLASNLTAALQHGEERMQAVLDALEEKQIVKAVQNLLLASHCRGEAEGSLLGEQHKPFKWRYFHVEGLVLAALADVVGETYQHGGWRHTAHIVERWKGAWRCISCKQKGDKRRMDGPCPSPLRPDVTGEGQEVTP